MIFATNTCCGLIWYLIMMGKKNGKAYYLFSQTCVLWWSGGGHTSRRPVAGDIGWLNRLWFASSSITESDSSILPRSISFNEKSGKKYQQHFEVQQNLSWKNIVVCSSKNNLKYPCVFFLINVTQAFNNNSGKCTIVKISYRKSVFY
jgi:hypothetical protein